ncbi:MAG: aspartyl/asparaginyl beta-hydroxylase domain-containing protein [Rhodanobacteraceae bacterium]|nr:aspartyl/asparaginyl beta-hydroxylase domain-containing protein [Rhodanobacteraceae bacterium]
MSSSTPTNADPAAVEAAAMARYQAGDLAGAASGFRALLELQPEHLIALQFLGFEATQRQDFAAAIEYHRRACAVDSNDTSNWFNLAMAYYGHGDLRNALDALDATLARHPNLIEAQLYRASMFEQMQLPEEAAKAYLRAVRFAETNMDARAIPPDLKAFLNHAIGVVRQFLNAQISRSLEDLVAAHGSEALARITRAGEMFSGMRPLEFAHPKWRPGLFYVPDLPVRTFYEREDFAWTERVEAATDMVRAELLKLLEEGNGFAPYVNHAEGTHGAQVFKDINKSSNWTSFHFFRHGERIEENCARCPGTAALLESIDLQRVPGYGPEAMFSVLRPHSRIPPHYGAVNGRLVVHLPLIVPPDCGALSVVGEPRGWTEGRLMMFDDSFEHEAWNDSDQTRIVLIFDTWNPHLSPVEREAFARVLSTAHEFESNAGLEMPQM